MTKDGVTDEHSLMREGMRIDELCHKLQTKFSGQVTMPGRDSQGIHILYMIQLVSFYNISIREEGFMQECDVEVTLTGAGVLSLSLFDSAQSSLFTFFGVSFETSYVIQKHCK